MKQISFKNLVKPNMSSGGIKGNLKAKRVLSTKLPVHLTLRAEVGHDTSMLHPRHIRNVNERVRKTAKKYGLTIYRYSNVGNHLHMVLKLSSRTLWSRFIRDLTGGIARDVQEIKGQEKPKWRFWAKKPHTRVVASWGKPFEIVKKYIELNILEGEGRICRLSTA